MGLKFLQWNAQGIKNKKCDFINLLHLHDVDIAIISETFLTRKDRNFYVTGYEVVRADRPPNSVDRNTRGGAAILVKKDFSFNIIKKITNNKIELVGIHVNLGRAKYLNVISLYAKCNHGITCGEWNEMLQDMTGKTVISGDFNGWHLSWDRNVRVENTEGRELYQFVENNEFVIMNNDTPTRVKRLNCRDSILDLTIMTHRLSVECCEWKVLTDACGSDHYPISFTIDHDNDEAEPIEKEIRNFKKANWALYRRKLEEKCEDLEFHEDENAEERYERFYQVINQVAETTIPRTKIEIKKRTKIKPCWWDPECNKTVAKRRLALHSFNKIGNMENYLSYRKEATKAKKYFRERKKIEFQNFTATLTPSTGSKVVWGKLRKLMKPEVGKRKVQVDRNFLTVFCKKLCPDVNQIIEINRNKIRNDFLDKKITLQEFEIAISHKKKYKYRI